jgi:hypothetical protein
LHRGPLEWHYLRTKFHENLPSGSEVITGGAHKQTGNLIRLFSFLESRLEMELKEIVSEVVDWIHLAKD